ncbi:MAG: hypothetical protein IJZ74_06610 [Clostridia bacterium]|nr:hypothetical protein [Clostridia bacterium]
MTREDRRCVRCHLPVSYPGIRFDGQGVCSLCTAEPGPEKEYKGLDALKERVQGILSAPGAKDRPYDAAVAFSGGRDSTYLLYFLKNVLQLNVLAVTLSHDFLPEHTRQNIQRIAQDLGVDLQMIPNETLNDCSRRCVRTWAHRPSAPMLLTFCTGCRYGLVKQIPDYCRKQGIPILFMGYTRMEKMDYRRKLLSSDPEWTGLVSRLTAYLGQAAANPRMLTSLKCTMVHGLEYFYFYRSKKIEDTDLAVPVTISPFADYVYVPEETLLSALESLGWQCDEAFGSTWRSDCYVNMLRQYYYDRMIGFNDLDVTFAAKVRQGLLPLDEALKRLEKEKQVSREQLVQVLQTLYGLDFDEIERKIDRLEARNS